MQLGILATPVFTTNVGDQNRQISKMTNLTVATLDADVGGEDRGCRTSELGHRSRLALRFSERHPGPLHLSVVPRGARRAKASFREIVFFGEKGAFLLISPKTRFGATSTPRDHR